jgi:hypothetical protein
VTEDQIRADERRRWAIACLGIVVEGKKRARADPSYERVWKLFTVFAHRLLDNDGPPLRDMELISEVGGIIDMGDENA